MVLLPVGTVVEKDMAVVAEGKKLKVKNKKTTPKHFGVVFILNR